MKDLAVDSDLWVRMSVLKYKTLCADVTLADEARTKVVRSQEKTKVFSANINLTHGRITENTNG